MWYGISVLCCAGGEYALFIERFTRTARSSILLLAGLQNPWQRYGFRFLGRRVLYSQYLPSGHTKRMAWFPSPVFRQPVGMHGAQFGHGQALRRSRRSSSWGVHRGLITGCIMQMHCLCRAALQPCARACAWTWIRLRFSGDGGTPALASLCLSQARSRAHALPCSVGAVTRQ